MVSVRLPYCCNHCFPIISVLFPYYFAMFSPVFPYYFPNIPLFFLLFPYCFPYYFSSTRFSATNSKKPWSHVIKSPVWISSSIIVLPWSDQLDCHSEGRTDIRLDKALGITLAEIDGSFFGLKSCSIFSSSPKWSKLKIRVPPGRPFWVIPQGVPPLK